MSLLKVVFFFLYSQLGTDRRLPQLKSIHWNKQALVSKNTPKVSYKNIKRSASGARA